MVSNLCSNTSSEHPRGWLVGFPCVGGIRISCVPKIHTHIKSGYGFLAERWFPIQHGSSAARTSLHAVAKIKSPLRGELVSNQPVLVIGSVSVACIFGAELKGLYLLDCYFLWPCSLEEVVFNS